MSAEIYQIVTFAEDVFAGNPAYVVVSDAAIGISYLQRLAHQLKEPVVAAISGLGSDLALRFAAPGGAHPGAGHTAHAAAYVGLRHLRPNARSISFQLDDGRVLETRANGDRLEVDWPIMPYEPVDAGQQVAGCIGVAPLETFMAPFGLVAVVDSAATVARIVPDLERIAALVANTLIVTARDETGDFAIRVFAPRIGLPEDPVCGTAHRILVPLWASRLGRTELVSRQLSPRGGTLYCRLGEGKVTLGGAATMFFNGTFAADPV